MKFVLRLTIVLLFSCSQQNNKPAESALDAAREYKTACANGFFKIAQFYLTEKSKQNFYFIELQNSYKKLSSTQKKETKEASLIIHSIKEISTANTQIIVSTSLNKIRDTLQLVKENNIWLVHLK